MSNLKPNLKVYSVNDIKSVNLLGSVPPETLKKANQVNLVLKYMQAKDDNPKLKSKEICSLIGTSQSTFGRILKDLSIPSFYRYKIPVNSKTTLQSVITKMSKYGNQTTANEILKLLNADRQNRNLVILEKFGQDELLDFLKSKPTNRKLVLDVMNKYGNSRKN